MTPRSLIGGHVFVTGGLAKGGLAYMADIGAEMIQVFVTNPRGWALTPGQARSRTPSSPSRASTPCPRPLSGQLRLPQPRDAGRLGRDRPLHAAARPRDRRQGSRGAHGLGGDASPATTRCAQLREHLLPLLDEIPEDGPDLLLEPMAGQGAMLCATVQDLEPYLAALDWHPRAGRLPRHLPRVLGRARPAAAERGQGDVRRAARDRARPAEADPRQRLQGRRAAPRRTATRTSAPATSAPSRSPSSCATPPWRACRSASRRRARPTSTARTSPR